MHEAGLIAGLMRRILEVAEAENATRVVGASVWLGALSHMSAAHLAEHFARAAAGTIAEGAALDIELSGDATHAEADGIVLHSVEVES
ncbi:MAG TPA: hydrogenase/urease maturation nickel metallochaperone HypA [Alphaproteobacteria bacterium]